MGKWQWVEVLRDSLRLQANLPQTGDIYNDDVLLVAFQAAYYRLLDGWGRYFNAEMEMAIPALFGITVCTNGLIFDLVAALNPIANPRLCTHLERLFLDLVTPFSLQPEAEAYKKLAGPFRHTIWAEFTCAGAGADYNALFICHNNRSIPWPMPGTTDTPPDISLGPNHITAPQATPATPRDNYTANNAATPPGRATGSSTTTPRHHNQPSSPSE